MVLGNFRASLASSKHDRMKQSRDESDSWPPSQIDPELEQLQLRYLPNRTETNMEGLLGDDALGRRCLVSSFGAESAVLLHWVTRVIPDIPVIFLDTHKHFRETLVYRDELTKRLKLNLRIISPESGSLAQDDPDGLLSQRNPDMCCMLRKTLPLQDALADFDTWISGRKRYQGARNGLPLLERDGNKIKINPLALWSTEEVSAYMRDNDLPPHPLVDKGFLSIGCEPCTRAPLPGEDARAGRWAHVPEKSECGIHLSPDGRIIRSRRLI